MSVVNGRGMFRDAAVNYTYTRRKYHDNILGDTYLKRHCNQVQRRGRVRVPQLLFSTILFRRYI